MFVFVFVIEVTCILVEEVYFTCVGMLLGLSVAALKAVKLGISCELDLTSLLSWSVAAFYWPCKIRV